MCMFEGSGGVCGLAEISGDDGMVDIGFCEEFLDCPCGWDGAT